MKHVKGGITAPKGFLASGINCGIKKEKKDLALIFSEKPCVATGLFTLNKVKAAPVILDIQKIHLGKKARAIIANSGNANACTGRKGLSDAREMAATVARAAGITEEEVLVASTGKIGEMLPIQKVKSGVTELAGKLSRNGGSNAARAIMTTDLFMKESAVEIRAGGKNVRIGGIAKGSGMIHPGLATMLCFITTDAVIDRGAIVPALQSAVNKSFNMITVDGERSTNDTILILANGAAANRKIKEGVSGYKEFCQALACVCADLAKKVVQDGEGATKFIEIKVKGASSFLEAKDSAFFIARSNLVKTAIFGEDPNWGRIFSAIGNSSAGFIQDMVEISINGVRVVSKGMPVPNREKAKKALKGRNVCIEVNLNMGSEEAVVWTSDLSYKYVKINAAYN